MKFQLQTYKTIIFTLSLGVILFWLSLFLSYQELPHDNDINEPFALGGFPYKVFEYPVPPMGSDWPPASSWKPFFINLAIWLATSFALSFFLGKNLKSRELLYWMFVLSVFFSIVGLVYIMLRFD